VSDVDVAVVGTGLAGLSAALEASSQDATVLLVEADATVGGRTSVSSGMIMGAGTRFQRERAIADSDIDLFNHYMTLTGQRLEPALIEHLTSEVGPSIEWLADLGVPILDIFPAGDELVPRGHVTPGGAEIVNVLEKEVRRRQNITVVLGRRVEGLVLDARTVAGVSSGEEQLTAAGTILATGGFEGNGDLIERYLPSALSAGDWLHPVGLEVDARVSRGDVFALAEQADAQIVGHNRGLCTLKPNFSLMSDTYFPGWLIIVNHLGRRFFNEMSPYSVTEPLVRAQGGKIWAIFDDAAKRASQPNSTRRFKKVNIPGQTHENWVEPMIDAMVGLGKIHVAATVEGLATTIDVPTANLAGTIDRYNEGVAAGIDHFYAKRADVLRPVQTPPFYATELRLACLAGTYAGVRIDRDARVIGNDSHPIAGLYAAGECVGGVLGDVYVGSGNALASALVFGRTAGRVAAAAAAAAAVKH
jgi:succinate dehydrogenase/fumarate reductase flavoprotein subunit